MSLEIAEKLVDEIVSKRKAHLQSKIQRFPANNFRASNIHECDRHMVYSVVNWKEQSLYDVGLQAIFDAGNKEEKNVKLTLLELGYETIEAQTAFEIPNRKGEVMCRGHIDGKIVKDGEAIPVEIKSMDPNIFRTINSIDDFQKKPHLRKYLRQMQMYLYGNNEEAGFFLISNFREHKLFVVTLDYGECEFILKRLERNWEMVKKKEYPDRIEYNEKLCSRCNFKHICLQEVKNEGTKMIDNKELEERLERREELKEYVSEYKSLDEEVKAPFKLKKIPLAFVGDSWQIATKVRTDEKLDTKALPDDIKKQYSKDVEVVTTTILKL